MSGETSILVAINETLKDFSDCSIRVSMSSQDPDTFWLPLTIPFEVNIITNTNNISWYCRVDYDTPILNKVKNGGISRHRKVVCDLELVVHLSSNPFDITNYSSGWSTQMEDLFWIILRKHMDFMSEAQKLGWTNTYFDQPYHRRQFYLHGL